MQHGEYGFVTIDSFIFVHVQQKIFNELTR